MCVCVARAADFPPLKNPNQSFICFEPRPGYHACVKQIRSNFPNPLSVVILLCFSLSSSRHSEGPFRRLFGPHMETGAAVQVRSLIVENIRCRDNRDLCEN